MKLILLTLLSFLILTSLSSQVFVDGTATGNNDGTSWTDAYTSLESAIVVENENAEIWISAGTYLAPATVDTNNTFFNLERDMKIYGGFSGTETSLSERDPETNLTIISADQNADDIAGSGDLNRLDNNKHIFIIQDTITNATIIDGITFMGGTTAPSTGSGDSRRGGAMLIFGAPIINNCTFTENYGYFGGCLYPRGDRANGTVITNCTFKDNYGYQGAGVYVLAEVTIADCTFENNSGTSRGLGVYFNNRSNTITNCTFRNNASIGSSAGALQLRSSSDGDVFAVVNVIDCLFEGNSATFGGATASYDSLSILNFENCTFANNSSVNVGGASSNAFGAESNFTNCMFISNASRFGGALFNQNDDGSISVDNCYLEGNTAEFGGAANFGGDTEGTDLSEVSVSNSVFTLNQAEQQGGAINVSDLNVLIESSLFTFNFNSNEGSIAGAMSLNTGDSISTTATLTNNTFADNSATIINGISAWEGGESANSQLIIQNNIFANEGMNVGIEDGNPEFISNGGNLSDGEDSQTILNHSSDLNNTDPQFLEEDEKEYYLEDESPAVNSGIDEGAPLLDIEGNPRNGTVDMGAFENQTVISLKDYLSSKTTLKISPNPVLGNEISFELDGELQDKLTVNILNNLGITMFSRSIKKTNENQVFTLGNLILSEGVYHLQVTNGKKSVSRTFIKIK